MSCFRKQLLIHKLPLPVDILHIVYDYCFKHIIDIQRKKKEAIINVIKKQTDIRYIDVVPGSWFQEHDHKYASIKTKCYSVNSIHVSDEFSSPQPETYLSYNICSKCGDFINPKTKARNKHPIMKYPWKRQRCNDEISPFSKVTCKEENYHFIYLFS